MICCEKVAEVIPFQRQSRQNEIECMHKSLKLRQMHEQVAKMMPNAWTRGENDAKSSQNDAKCVKMLPKWCQMREQVAKMHEQVAKIMKTLPKLRKIREKVAKMMPIAWESRQNAWTSCQN